MDRTFLEQLYCSNKIDMLRQEFIITTIETLQEELQSKCCGNTSNLLYELLCNYFSVGEDDVTLLDIISEATVSNNYKTLSELEDKVNEIRKGE